MKPQINKYELDALLNWVKDMRDCLIEAPVDFLGTGSNSAAANKEEREWRNKWQDAYIAAESLIERYNKT